MMRPSPARALLRSLWIGAALMLWGAAAHAQGLTGVDLKKLAKPDVDALTELMKQGACPCAPKLSLLDCIGAASCPEATALASFGADKFREGLGAEQVQEAVIRKYLFDHTPAQSFELGDTPSKGDPNGDIVVVEFADFECPHCAQMGETMTELVKKHPKGIKLYFKQFPLGVHPQSEKAARATLAAHKQGRFWPMHDLCFQNQGRLDDTSYGKFAAELGLNLEKFQADMASEAVGRQVQRDREEGMAAGLQGTPTLYVNGKLYHEDKTIEGLESFFERVRAQAREKGGAKPAPKPAQP
jgi:protein-disulfide isomerase